MRLIMAASLAISILSPAALSADPATAPAPATLFGGKIEYTPPAGWSTVQSNLPADVAAVYIADDHDGYCALQVLPENASISSSAAQKILAQLRVNHKKAGQEIVEPAKIIKDPHFAIRIHERYKTKEGGVADESHLYRQVGGRAMELDVQSLSDNSKQVQLVQKAGEDLLLSAHWVKATSGKKKAN